jgi:hypothetical protein
MGRGIVINKRIYRESMREFIQFVSILTVGVEEVLDYLNSFFEDTNKPTK